MAVLDERFSVWCESLARLQMEGTGDPHLDGALLCPACGRIHGRCADAMHPFLVMAEQTGDRSWVARAEALFDWTEVTLSRADGSLLNDIDSSWNGITVFYAAQLADCLRYHSDLLEGQTYDLWAGRLARAAEFLTGCDTLDQDNVNYSIGLAYALERAGSLLGVKRYCARGERSMELAITCLEDSGLLFGEGVPRHRLSSRGCRPVDIGYNVEESLPIMARYACERHDLGLMERVRGAFLWHLGFMLPDGGWDNSFGTRKFKWTYWGSRTTDGSYLGLALAARGAREPVRGELLAASRANLGLIFRCCDGQGLLAGGPHYVDAGQRSCIHHTFDHVKSLAGAIDLGLMDDMEGDGADWTPRSSQPLEQYPDLGVAVIRKGDMRATVCATDWEYEQDACTSGGMISLLHHRVFGAVCTAGMGSYRRIEPANMQVPCGVRHESLAPRIELEDGRAVWSSIFDLRADMVCSRATAPLVHATGVLRDARHVELPESRYTVRYRFDEDGVAVRAEISAGTFVLPLIGRSCEQVEVAADRLSICRLDGSGFEAGVITLEVLEGGLHLPYGTERVFNLTPGFQAVRVDIVPEGGRVSFRLSCKTK